MLLAFTGVSDLPDLTELSKSLRRSGAGGIEGADGRRFAGGQFIPADLWEAEKVKARAAFPELLADFDEEMQYHRSVYEQNAGLFLLPDVVTLAKAAGVKLVPLSTIEYRIKKSIRLYYARSFLLGKKASGNLLSANATELDVLTDLRRDEFTYLRKFLHDMETASGVMDYEERMHWYAAAAREVWNLGFVLGNPSKDRTIEWYVGPTEHCADCLKMAGKYKGDEFAKMVRETGLVPQSGKLSCRGFHCQCGLRDVPS